MLVMNEQIFKSVAWRGNARSITTYMRYVVYVSVFNTECIGIWLRILYCGE